MKKINKSRSSGMPMLEIVISIGMFTIISVFILQMFMAANNLQKDAVDLSKAVIQAEMIGEAIKGTDSIEEAAQLLKLRTTENGSYQKCFDEDWKESKVKSVYFAKVDPTVEETEYGFTSKFIISIYKELEADKKQELYQLPITRYQTKEIRK